MTDMTSIDMGHADTSPIDLAPFFARYDRRQRVLFGGSLCVSLVLSSAIATHVFDTGWTGPKPVLGAVWGIGILFAPLFTVGWWTFAELMALGRRKTTRADGSHPASAIDARNGMRIANGGFVFNIGLMATAIIQQVLIALLVFGFPPVGLLVPRLTMVLVGAVTLYLGNLWPRMPVARTPDRSGAIRMKANRYSGRIMVVAGLLIILLGLCLPLLHPALRP